MTVLTACSDIHLALVSFYQIIKEKMLENEVLKLNKGIIIYCLEFFSQSQGRAVPRLSTGTTPM